MCQMADLFIKRVSLSVTKNLIGFSSQFFFYAFTNLFAAFFSLSDNQPAIPHYLTLTIGENIQVMSNKLSIFL